MKAADCDTCMIIVKYKQLLRHLDHKQPQLFQFLLQTLSIYYTSSYFFLLLLLVSPEGGLVGGALTLVIIIGGGGRGVLVPPV